MAEHRAISLACLLALLAAGALAEWTPPEERPYKHYSMDQEDICHPLATVEDRVQDVTDLRANKYLAIIVKPSHAFSTWRVLHDKRCRFKVKASKGDGLFAVVQRMSLRQNASGECIDFIRFLSENGGSTSKLCGMVNYRMLDPATKVVDEFSASGKITTEIFISKQPLESGEKLDLEITYTPYKASVCKYNSYPGQWWSSYLYQSSTCINKKLVCDGYTNCFSPICFDEGNCSDLMDRSNINIVSDGTGTKVTISAVTTIFLCFIIFVLCLWICRKHKKLCWSPDCAGPPRGPPTTISGSTSGLPMERGVRNASSPPYVSSAPMLEVAVPTSVNNKDLPPSYDSLFPNQSNTANT